MDDSHMGHGKMGHGSMSHGGMDHGGMSSECSMNMLFTWDATNTCVIFRSWRITSTFSLIVSLLAIVVLTAGYEGLREASRRYEARCTDMRDRQVTHSTERQRSKSPARRTTTSPKRVTFSDGSERDTKFIRAAFYAVQVFYSFLIMLLFMTYNGWIMLAVTVGAFVGYLMFANSASAATKSAACH